MNLNNIDNNGDDNGFVGGNDNRGKFSDRLKKIRRDRLKIRNRIPLEKDIKDENIFKRGGRNIFKILLATPMVAYSALKTDEKNNSSSVSKNKEDKLQLNNLESPKVGRKIKVNKIREMNVSLLKKQKEMYIKEQNKIFVNKLDKAIFLEEEKTKEVEYEQKIVKLQKEIIDLIKKKLVKNINELEVLQSELYILKEINGEDIYLKKCQEDIKEIKKLLSKIKSLKEKYDYLKDNIDFEYMLEYGDEVLIDKILELKELCSSKDVKYIVDNYKILEEYKFLYLKIDKLQEETVKYDEYKNEKEKELEKRDINFDKLKNEVYNVNLENERYESFVNDQEHFLKQLEEKISNIDSHEQVTYRLKGFNRLLTNSFKYLGLLLLSPLKGLVPGITTQTLMTKNVVHNLYNHLEWQENKKMVYEAIDYSTSINVARNSLDDTLSLVNSTLDDVLRLKVRYQKEFSKYQSSFSGYKEMMKKINKMENAIMGNKIKIELMQERMKEKEKQNSDKMKMVKKLNSSENN